MSKYHLPVMVWGLLVALTLTCCTTEERTDCPRPVELSVEVVNVEGEDITDQGAIETLSLYVFDNRKEFLQLLNARVGEPLRLYFPDQDTLYVVSWGNLTEGKQELPQLTRGTPMHQAIIRLAEAPTRAATGTTRNIVQSPDDLFYSYSQLSLKSGTSQTFKLQMQRAVGSMSITMRHLQNYANRYDDNYSLVVRDTYSGIDFYGRLTGDKVGYRPATHFNEEKELIAPLFNLFPSDADGVIEVDVYHGGQLITTVTKDNEGRPLRVQRGQVLNVLVDFHLQVSVTVAITPWGETQIWKDF